MRLHRFALLILVALTARAAEAQGTPRGATDAGRSQKLPASVRYVPPAGRVPAHFPDGWGFPAGRAPVVAKHAMAVSDAPIASAVGADVMRRGGNAVDAAVATAFALAVVYPEAGNIGGGGFMVIHLADGRDAALDFREKAPLTATRDMYVGFGGKVTNQSIVGPLASGVPGSVAGLTTALARYGTMPLARVMQPAIRLAERGFVVDSAFSQRLSDYREVLASFGGGAVFAPNGQPLKAGAVLKQPALARTLRAIARTGGKAFYEGPIAEAWVKEFAAAGGIITIEDLRRYRAEWRTPIRSSYRGRTIVAMPPSSSGGVTMTETLNILEGFDTLPPFGSMRWAHLVGSAFQRAFIDRNAKLGDPAFVDVPLAQLTDKRYAASLRATIGASRATPTSSLTTMKEGAQTTHLSVADARGNAAAITTTLNELYGSGVFIASAGFFLNDEMDDFTSRPGVPNMFGLVQGEANAIAPGKRMLSAMSPTIVLDPRGRVELVVGSRGGPRIITSTTEVVMNVLDYRMTLADAMSAPRLHHQALPDVLRVEKNGISPAVSDSLTAMGYAISAEGGIGQVNAIMRVPGGFEGVADPRGSGRPIGY
jgi:gamma-glutamyltranspeptidase/glutathione hydrolase